MHDFTRRALLQGGTALAATGALTGEGTRPPDWPGPGRILPRRAAAFAAALSAATAAARPAPRSWSCTPKSASSS